MIMPKAHLMVEGVLKFYQLSRKGFLQYTLVS
jgi:hypothetical protein